MKADAAGRALTALGRIARRYGAEFAARKHELLASLGSGRLRTARQVLRLHELLCFLDAYPDEPRIRRQARRLLRAFSTRADLRRHRLTLAGSGIAGTDTPFRFFWPTAHWISETWPGALVLDRRDRAALEDIRKSLPQVVDRAQAEWLRSLRSPAADALDRLVPDGITDADFLIGLVKRLPGNEFSRETWFDRLDPSFLLRAGKDTPERSTARFDRLPLRFQTADFPAVRPELRQEARRAPLRVRALRGHAVRDLIRLARVSMITRERDLEVFEYPNASDAFLVDDSAGLGFALLGLSRERRATIAATFAGLILQNGVPVGYLQLDLTGRHGALSFNLFETFRGAGAARTFARLVAVVHHLFGCDAFSIEPYQLGQGNDEGIETGAWWFYHRMGFRPRTAAARRLAARELARRKRDSRHRSSARTLRQLARSHLLFSLDPSQDVDLPRTDHWLAESASILRRYRVADPALRQRRAVEDALRRLGSSQRSRRSPGERAWIARWAGLIQAWTASGRWSDAERRALHRLMIEKSGRSEREFQRRLLGHVRLCMLLGG